MALADMISSNNNIELTEDLIKKWNSVGVFLKTKHINKVVDLDGAVEYEFINDFEGLLLYYGIPHEYIYPHIIANGLTSSIDYDGNMKTMNVLDLSALNNYIALFMQN